MTSMVSESEKAELRVLVARLEQLHSDFYTRVAKPSFYWNLHYGPVHVRARMSSQRIAGLFISFCLLAFISGVACTLIEATRELGVALVVGALFTGGSFLIQYWSLQVDKEQGVYGALDAERDRRLIEKFADEMNKITSDIESIDPSYFQRD